MKFNDLTGKKFGRLLVLKRVEDKIYPSGKRGTAYLCKCECGMEKVISSTTLNSGHAKSCGCLQNEARVKTHTIHGNRKHRLYNIWTDMKQRCTNNNSPDFANYGGRGITVCDEWLNDFQAFYDWSMSNGYEDHLTIDRKDVNGNYCPENCRWATRLVQRHNRRDSAGMTLERNEVNG